MALILEQYLILWETWSWRLRITFCMWLWYSLTLKLPRYWSNTSFYVKLGAEDATFPDACLWLRVFGPSFPKLLWYLYAHETDHSSWHLSKTSFHVKCWVEDFALLFIYPFIYIIFHIWIQFPEIILISEHL